MRSEHDNERWEVCRSGPDSCASNSGKSTFHYLAKRLRVSRRSVEGLGLDPHHLPVGSLLHTRIEQNVDARPPPAADATGHTNNRITITAQSVVFMSSLPSHVPRLPRAFRADDALGVRSPARELGRVRQKFKTNGGRSRTRSKPVDLYDGGFPVRELVPTLRQRTRCISSVPRTEY